ncbi:MAG: hypothetical protein JWN71_1814 [Xanthobacteraceae bacterium]|jgi:hypothetical protein|nr:hypothetical protein [Xanthobacteraceae bacterium]
MHDDHTPRRFPWFRLAFGGISILVLIGTFAGFMWLLRTYVDPPKIASAPPIQTAASGTATPDMSREPRVIMAPRAIAPEIPSSMSRSEPEPQAPGLSSPSSPITERQVMPNAGLSAWPNSPFPGAANSPPASADAGSVSFDGPVPLPRSKPRLVVRVQLPANAPLPRSRPPS